MDAIILAAGRGTRLRPLTDTQPKPLIAIAGKGTLLHTLDALPSNIDHIILIVGHLQEKIREAVGQRWNDIPLTYVTQHELNGTGGALRDARMHIRSERFLVLNGDDLYHAPDLAALAAIERGVLIQTKPVHKTMDTWRRRSEDGRINALLTTQTGNVGSINVGAYLLGHEWFATTPVLSPGKTDEWSLPHPIPQLTKQYKYQAIEATHWFPCGTFEEIVAAEDALRQLAKPNKT